MWRDKVYLQYSKDTQSPVPKITFVLNDSLCDIINRQIISGKILHEDRWRDCVASIDGSVLAGPLGAMYVRDYFDEESKTVAKVKIKFNSSLSHI